MAISPESPGVVVGVSPFGTPRPRLAAAVANGGGLGVLDLGDGDRSARAALHRLTDWCRVPFAVRIGPRCALTPADLPASSIGAVLLAIGSAWRPSDAPAAAFVLAEVGSVAQARQAVADGAHGLVTRGSECGGPVGELAGFVLVQRLLAEFDLPVWACGTGERTAAGAVLAGAAGVLLDTQLALFDEAETPGPVRGALAGMDGSETTVLGGHRVLHRRGPNALSVADDVDAVAAALGADDPDRQLLPVGQDGFLAARFAAEYADAASAVRAVRARIEDTVRAGTARRAADGLAPESTSWLGSPLPVAQGPMTRVSDQAAFAGAVAGDGALPFVALALANREKTTELLHATKDALGERPWGVGVLGFAPEETRSAQLEVIRQLRPSHAIIAGGRPAQARDLEEHGIRTFLHVPSPGLARQFLRAGARRFVFEGAECGGHVGPRNSFPLWEAQLAVVAEYLDAHPDAEVELLFAGGVHDARSAAAVAAMAAGETGRGVRVGVLMGTAYLFTEEAVTHGAVRPLFQRRTLTAESTALLTTAPGHATRCLPSPFATEFDRITEELRERGVPQREAWEHLERLNVGRLRIASKGVERDGDDLREVAEDRQLDEGMFMAGEVAVLRSAVTSTAALHADVSTRAATHLTDRAATLRETFGIADEAPAAAPEPLDIAIVGMSALLPQAHDLAEFWANVLAGRDTVTEVPTGRWNERTYYSAAGESGYSASKWGGFLPEIPFDPLRFGIPPASLASIEPVQLLALYAADRALTDAGYAGAAGDGGRGFDRSRASVVFGAEAGSDLSNATVLRTTLPGYLGELPEPLERQLPELTEDSFPGMLANVIAGRIANRLDLGGTNYTVDAACASSLAAVDAACKELTARTSDVVLCGGADLHNGIHDYLLFSSVGALSRTGRSRPFDSQADGIALGEGVACLVLKRLADARRDGDRVYAVIAGVGGSSDGRSLGLTAPRPEGQRAALERAYANAGFGVDSVGLIEAHGTGTVVGDRTELNTLTAMFDGTTPGACALGSVKSQIGHTKCTAGLAGMIKTAMALHTGVLPPTGNLNAPNPAWQAESSPFRFHTEASPWPTPVTERRAGVSAFGFGGTNFHVALRGHDGGPPPASSADVWPVELFCFRGRDDAAVHAEIGRLLELLEADGNPPRLRDLAATAARRADERTEPVRVAVLAADTAELADALRRAASGETDERAGIFRAADVDPDGGSLAFLFPGQGSQRPGMLAQLFVTFPDLQRYLQLEPEVAEALFPAAAFDSAGKDAALARLTDTRMAQPALGMTGLAVHELFERAGVRPDMVAGHSYGELAALAAAGALDADTLLTISRARAEAILTAAGDDPGTMAAVSAAATDIEATLGSRHPDVVLANRNAPAQTVISGPTPAVEAAVAALREAGLSARAIPVACAFHSPVVAGGGELFARTLAGVPVHRAELPVYANRTAAPYPADAEGARAELAAQIGNPVRFAEQIEAMYAAGARTFVEAGPGAVLTKLASAVLRDRPHRTVTVQHPDGDLRGFLAALARLATSGVGVRTGWLFAGRDARDLTGVTPAKRPGWTVDGHLVRTADGTIPGGALTPAELVQQNVVPRNAVQQSTVQENVVTHPDVSPHRTGDPIAVGDGHGEALVAEFLRSTREAVAAQRDVLLSYFGGTATSVGPVTTTARQRPAAAQPREPVQIAPVGGPASTASAAVPEPARPAGPPDLTTITSTVVDIIAERTGYPAEMIAGDLDLEADLSIDSIKRAEIAGELALRLDLTTNDTALTDDELEELSRARTTDAIATWLAAKANSAPPATPKPEPARPAGPPDLTTITSTVVDIIAERTGYPAEMIAGDLDLEADLSIDSIKRAEIAGELALRLDLTTNDTALTDDELEELSRARTTDAIATWLAAKSGATEVSTVEDTAATVDTAKQANEPVAVHAAPRRMVFREIPLDDRPGDAAELAGKRVTVLGEGPITDTLTARLAELGAEPVTATAQGAHAVLHLGALPSEAGAEDDPMLPESFPSLQSALAGAPAMLVLPSFGCSGDNRSDGLRGFVRTLVRECPDTVSRLVELPDSGSATDVADTLIAELLTPGAAAVVRHRDGARHGEELVEQVIGTLAAAGAGPSDDGTAETAALGLDRDSVLLLAGGARGISARFATLVASAARCRIELIGRTPLPTGQEDAELAAAPDATALRRVLAGRGGTPAEIERSVRTVLAQREVATTLAELTELGATARYHCADICDSDAVRRVVKEIHTEHGRIDGVLHAAGVIEDKLLAQKDIASFRRVWSTKVDGAVTLLDAVGELEHGPAFAVLFGSIAAALGNRGQVDYASANDALTDIGARWSTENPGCNTITVHWGPWAPAGGHDGMVTPELEREYARRGIALIDPEEGTRALLRELAYGGDHSAVVYTASGW